MICFLIKNEIFAILKINQGTSNRVLFNLTKKTKAKKIEHKGKPQVQIITPNGGEKFVQGNNKITVSWSGGTDKVILALEERGLDWNVTAYYYVYYNYHDPYFEYDYSDDTFWIY